MSLFGILGSAVLGGLFQNNAANKATSAQVTAQERADEITRRMGRRAVDKIEGGSELALDALRGGRSAVGDLYRPIIKDGDRYGDVRNFLNGIGERPQGYGGMQETDAYKFRVNEMMDATQNSAAARGALRSGATLKALQDRSYGLANQFENNYFSRINDGANMGINARNALAGYKANFAGNIAGIQNGTGIAAGNALMNVGNNLANGATAAGNARSAGAIAQGNAFSDAGNNAIGGWMYGKQAGLF